MVAETDMVSVPPKYADLVQAFLLMEPERLVNCCTAAPVLQPAVQALRHQALTALVAFQAMLSAFLAAFQDPDQDLHACLTLLAAAALQAAASSWWNPTMKRCHPSSVRPNFSARVCFSSAPSSPWSSSVSWLLALTSMLSPLSVQRQSPRKCCESELGKLRLCI